MALSDNHYDFDRLSSEFVQTSIVYTDFGVHFSCEICNIIFSSTMTSNHVPVKLIFP